MLQEVTLATSAQELMLTIREQSKRAWHLQSTITRLEYLLQTVLKPEESFFAQENQLNKKQSASRRKSIQRAFAEMQKTYEARMSSSRYIISEQRDNVAEFVGFHDVLLTIIQRMGKNFDTLESDMNYLEDKGGIEGEVLAKTLKFFTIKGRFALTAVSYSLTGRNDLNEILTWAAIDSGSSGFVWLFISKGTICELRSGLAVILDRHTRFQTGLIGWASRQALNGSSDR